MSENLQKRDTELTTSTTAFNFNKNCQPLVRSHREAFHRNGFIFLNWNVHLTQLSIVGRFWCRDDKGALTASQIEDFAVLTVTLIHNGPDGWV